MAPKNNEKFRLEKNPQVALQIAQNRMSASWNYLFATNNCDDQGSTPESGAR
jgi:hypothetical protein